MKRKTSVRSYERRDGTKVRSHERSVDAASLPKSNSESYVKPPRNSDVDLSPEEYKGVKVYFERLPYGDIQAKFYNEDKGVWEATFHTTVSAAYREAQERIDEIVFIPHGGYTVSNRGGFEVQLSEDGTQARLRSVFVGEESEVTEWLDIESDVSEDEEGEIVAVIDPKGYNIPMDRVERVDY